MFELKTPRSPSLVLASGLAMAVHLAFAAWAFSMFGAASPALVEPMPVVVFRKAFAPPPPPAVLPEAGGSGRRDAQRRKRVSRSEAPLLEPMVPRARPAFMLFANAAYGVGVGASGNGFGAGEGSGSGRIDAGVSKARRAWFATNSWQCDRPENEDEAGRVVVKIRVTVEADGRPSAVFVTSPGPEVFNVRAVMCASVEEYVPALDDAGEAFRSDAEFGIEFLTSH